MEENKPKRGRPKLSDEERIRRKHERDAKTRELDKTMLERQTLAAQQGKQLSKFGQEYVEPGDNSRYLRHALVTMGMPPIDISDPHQVEERIFWYFGHCIDHDMKPTVKGFCNSLGISRQTLMTWKQGRFREDTHQAIILRAYNILEELWEDYMQNGKINPVSGIFLAKNNFNYVDKQEHVLTPNAANTDEFVDLATIEAKYSELPED